MFQATKPPQQHNRKRNLKQYFDHKTQDLMTALHLFCRSGSRYEDIKTIIEIQPQLVHRATPNGGDTPLHFAVAAHDLRTIQLLLQKHPSAANIKSTRRGNFGSQTTPLHTAILTNASFEIIEALVQASPGSVNLRDGNGHTAYQLAIQYCDIRDDMKNILACL